MTWFCQSCVYFFLFRNEEEDSCFCVSVRMLLLHNFFQLHRKQDCLRTSLSHRLQVWDTCVMLQWKNYTRAAHFPHNCRFKFVEKNKTLITLRYRTAVLGYRVYSSDPVKSVLQYPVFQSANFRRRIGIFDTRTLL